jgi:hypothetical protein
MKNYNKNLIDKTNDISQKTLEKSFKKVNILTSPPAHINRIGCNVGKTLGVIMIVVGAIEIVKGKSLLGSGSCIAGVSTIVSNFIAQKK